ncbi:MAG TPA: ATP-binding protein [Terracidiphilus sp.]|jgi:signal transduction histidine kinase|nr:ATP-binding protein [Terracidiphilus sp.]
MSDSHRQRSIASTLTWMNILTIGIALILVYASFLAYNLYSIQASAIQNLSGEAQIVGANSVSAIVFDDRISAAYTLSALSNSGDIVAAAIFTEDAGPFAQYPATEMTIAKRRALAQTPKLEHWANGTDILVASRIDYQGRPVGVVYLQAHLNGLERQATRYGAIAGGILLICLCVALLVGSRFRRILAQPVVSLAQTARLVSRYRDYSLRFEPERSYNELESLTEAFNEMLAEIEQRDEALERAKTELEQRVEERTAQLQAANRELEAFSYTVAHDLRAPLQAINNICFLMREGDRGSSSENRAGMLAQMGSSVAMMSAMIDDLLDLSRSTSAPLHSRQLDLSLLAAAILDGLERLNPGRKAEIVVQKRCHVNADPGLMQIAMQNLLRNAWKFTSRCEQARIEFGCENVGKSSVYFIRDNGAGFDQRVADRLFKPFQRLHAASEYPGTGIGLTTVKRIIERHGGEVWAEGEVGKGATFYFTIDAHRPQQSWEENDNELA